MGVLLVGGLLGNQGGGEGISNVVLSEPPRAEGQADLDIGPQVGRLAPDFEISDFDGSRRKLSDFRGKAVYINFWATWCVPCTVELPDIQTIEQRHADELVVIAVNRRESLNSADPYFDNIPRTDGGSGVDFTVNGLDPDDTLYREYQGLGMPVSFFIDPSGVVNEPLQRPHKPGANGRISIRSPSHARRTHQRTIRVLDRPPAQPSS